MSIRKFNGQIQMDTAEKSSICKMKNKINHLEKLISLLAQHFHINSFGSITVNRSTRSSSRRKNQTASITIPKTVRNTTQAKTVNRTRSSQRRTRRTPNTRSAQRNARKSANLRPSQRNTRKTANTRSSQRTTRKNTSSSITQINIGKTVNLRSEKATDIDNIHGMLGGLSLNSSMANQKGTKKQQNKKGKGNAADTIYAISDTIRNYFNISQSNMSASEVVMIIVNYANKRGLLNQNNEIIVCGDKILHQMLGSDILAAPLLLKKLIDLKLISLPD